MLSFLMRKGEGHEQDYDILNSRNNDNHNGSGTFVKFLLYSLCDNSSVSTQKIWKRRTKTNK